MARFYKPPSDRAQKFVDKLKTIASDPAFNLIGPRGGQSVLTALSNFLASFGPRVARLSKTARGQLLQQNQTQDQAMREKAITQLQNNSKREIKNLMERYSQKKIDAVALKSQFQQVLRRQALGSAIIGVRGAGNLTPNVLTAVKRQLATQLAYLDGFIEELTTRNPTPRDKSRAQLYASASWAISQTATRQFNLDTSGVSAVQLEERRRLGGAEHCDDCIELASEEWEPFGTLPVPGTGTVCGDNCRCTLEVRPVQAETTSENPVPQG